MADTHIEWSEVVWNPTTGCDRVSDGCDHCYALTMAARLKAMGQAKYQRDGDPRTSGPGFGLTKHPDVLEQPLRWRKPRKVFVNSMSDLFHEEVNSAFLAAVFDVMRRTPQHIYQILTKRHGRLRSVMRTAVPGEGWPLPNVHIGVTVENQQWADIRVPALLGVEAEVRWLSCEPLLGPVDLSPWLHGLQWVVVGGESGPDARPMELDWARQIVRQCQDAGVPVFVKQDSGPKPGMRGRLPDDLWIKEFPAAVPS
jgi:protein gp37